MAIRLILLLFGIFCGHLTLFKKLHSGHPETDPPERGSDGGDYLSNQTIQVRVGRAAQVEVLHAEFVYGLKVAGSYPFTFV
jgi:hypothetical protein